MYDNGHREVAAHEGQVEQQRKPFVPDPHRVIYPVDHVTSQRAALEKFWAETRIEVGGQLTERLVNRACNLEDKIRSRVHDDAQYASLSVVLSTFLADAIQVRHNYMNPDDDPRRFR
jgi:hypothetical protein